MDLELSGRRALITGSTGGIGAAIAHRLAAEGVLVAINGRNLERAEAMRDEIAKRGGQAVLAVGDLESDAGVDAVAAAALEGLGDVDILINNVGGPASESTGRLSWFEVDTKYWMATYYKCVVAGVRLAQRFAPAMAQRGWGRIVNFSSVIGNQPLRFVSDYAAAKAAVNNVTVSLAHALAQTGVTVNTITPGGIMTDAQARWLEKIAAERGWTGELDDFEARRIAEEADPPLTTRLGRSEQIADVVAMICSPTGDFIDAANFRIDGGQTRGLC